jgi:protein O-mannosyl-transferase
MVMKLTKAQKEFINKNIEGSTASKLANKLDVKKRLVDKYIVSAGLSNKKKQKKIKRKEKVPYIKLMSLMELFTFWKNHWFVLVGIACITFLAYANSLKGDFISDDIAIYINNPMTKSLINSLKTLEVTQILHALNYHFFGENPLPSHVTSIVTHVFVAGLGFTVLTNFFSRKVSLLATLLFILHPANVEAITWVSGRVYPIIAIYTLLTILFYILYKNSKKYIYLIVATIMYIIASITTNVAQILIILPIIAVIDQFFLEYRIKIKSWLNFLPFVLSSGGFVYYLLSQERLINRIQETGTTVEKATPYITRFGYSIYKALVLLFYPVRLSLYHDAETITQTTLRWMFILTVALFIIIVGLWKKNRKATGLILIGIASILYMISPYQVAWFIAERYLYIATLCFTTLIAIIFVNIEKRYRIKQLALIMTLLVAGLYSTRVITRNNDWQTRKTLWESTRNAYPKSARTYNNLGDVYAEDGEMDRAIEAFEKAIELNPTYADALHNLGFTYLKTGDLEKAEEYFEKTIVINPNIPQAYYHLGIVKYELGDKQKTLEHFEKALEIQPDYKNALMGVERVKSEL